MQGKIGEINREQGEITEGDYIENTVLSIQVDGYREQDSSEPMENKGTTSLFSRISKFISESIEKSASKRIEIQKTKQKSSRKSAPHVSSNDSKWSVGDSGALQAKLCNQCSTYNEADSNYCNSCGAYIS